MAVLSKHFNVHSANIAAKDFISNTSPKYVFVSHPQPWNGPDGFWNDSIVHDANIAIQQSQSNTYNELVFGKLIRSDDVIQMIPRYNWESGIVYTRYSGHNANLYSTNFYIVTDDLNVYKCIDNNYDSPSLVKPTVTSTKGSFFTSDGYIWKYMYTIPLDTDTKFSTINYVPVVSNNEVIERASPGAIETITITSFGSNYKAFYSGLLKNSVNGYVVILDANASPYTNYYVGSSMYLKAGFGAGQLRKIVAYDGLNKFVRLETPFNIFATLSLDNVNGLFNDGDTLTQNLDSLAIIYYQGVFQIGDTIIQSDTAANGVVVAANSTYLQVVRESTNSFNLSYPVYATKTSGLLANGTATSLPFTQLYTYSNTASFTNGEIVYQSNGSVNVGIGVLFSTSESNTINASFNPIVAVNTVSNFVNIPGNTYELKQQLKYFTANGNTSIFPLSNNGTYYVSFSNGTGIAISNTSGGANVALSLKKTGTFNSNTGINGNFITISSNWFTNAQQLVYTVSPGNTIPTGLANGFTYYAVFANSTGTALSLTQDGPNVEMQATSISETGHTLTFSIPPEIGHNFSHVQQKFTLTQVNGAFVNTYQIKGNTSTSNAVLKTAEVDSNGLAYVYSTNTAQTTFTTTFPPNTYIRVGNNVNLNIRRVVSSNSSTIIVDQPLFQAAVSNVIYLVPHATEIISYTVLSANGRIVNTDLTSVIVSYSNPQKFGTIFIPGERVDLVNGVGLFQGTYGTVSFSNTSSVVISGMVGTGFVEGFYVTGESSLQFAFIDAITNYPTLTVEDPLGQFTVGQQVYSRNTANLSLINGSANVLTYFVTPGQLTEYIISPTITISGDGTGALAYSTVNTTPTVNLPLANVIVINSGIGYTYANCTITSNISYGSGASAIVGLSPLLGHGYNPHDELGASYVGISVSISNSVLESYYFPSSGKYRKVGILDSPMYRDLRVNLSYFDRIKLTLTGTSNVFTVGEVVYQPNSKAAGVVVYSNTTFLELKNVKGTFAANGQFANAQAANDNVVGLYSNVVANVYVQNVVNFDVVSNNQMVYEVNAVSSAVLVSITDETNLQFTNVSGLFIANDMLYDPTINAYAFVNSMYSVNGSINSTNSFGLRFNQTLRIPLTSNTISFQLFEAVTQDISNASGIIINGSVSVPSQISANVGKDVDLVYTDTVGSFPIGSIIYSTGNVGVGVVISSNTEYLRLSAVNGYFTVGTEIKSTINATATVSNVFPVLILNNIDGDWSSGILSGNIHGSNSGAVGRSGGFNTILYPDLVRNSGQVLYFENLEPFNLSNTSQENITLIVSY